MVMSKRNTATQLSSYRQKYLRDLREDVHFVVATHVSGTLKLYNNFCITG